MFEWFMGLFFVAFFGFMLVGPMVFEAVRFQQAKSRPDFDEEDGDFGMGQVVTEEYLFMLGLVAIILSYLILSSLEVSLWWAILLIPLLLYGELVLLGLLSVAVVYVVGLFYKAHT